MAKRQSKSKSALNASTLGAHLDMTRQRVRQLDRLGVFKRLPGDCYDVDASRIAYIRWLRDEERRAAKGAAAARLNDAKAQAIELRVARETRDVIPTNEALDFVSEALGRFRSDFQSIPARVTRDVPIRRRIEAEIDAVFAKAAKHFREESAALRGAAMEEEASGG